MNILQVYQIFNPEVASGAAKVAYYVSKELARRGHNVVYYASDMKDKDTRWLQNTWTIVNGINVQYFKTVCTILARKLKIYITPSLIKPNKRFFQKINVIHLHGYISFQCIVIYHYARKYGVPYVLQAHGSLPRVGAWRRLKWLYDVLFGYRLLRGASKVIALTRIEAEQYRSMGVPEEKIAIIPNGIDLSEYAELPPKGAFKKKFNIPEDRKIILYLGRIHKIKGVDFLIRAYVYLKNKMNFKDAVLVIAGPDDGFLGEVKSLVQSLGISGFVIFTGPLYEKIKLGAYVDSDIVVLPSRYETFPNVVLEAYACSKPVVASNVEAIPDIVLHGKTGLLFQAGDIKGLANAIAYMLAHSEEAERMGRNARRLVEERFSIDRVVTQLEALYEKVLKDERGNA